MIALTKTQADEDFPELAPELTIVDHFAPTEQARRWEYAMALRAMNDWMKSTKKTKRLEAFDIGGAGSKFRRMLPINEVCVIDPSEPNSMDLRTFAMANMPKAPLVFCISVIEHVVDEELDQFIDDLTSTVLPGGLLFLTTDIWDKEDDEPDSAHFHWMRKRIYTPRKWQHLSAQFTDRGFGLFGLADWNYHGWPVYSSYNFATLSLVRER